MSQILLQHGTQCPTLVFFCPGTQCNAHFLSVKQARDHCFRETYSGQQPRQGFVNHWQCNLCMHTRFLEDHDFLRHLQIFHKIKDSRHPSRTIEPIHHSDHQMHNQHEPSRVSSYHEGWPNSRSRNFHRFQRRGRGSRNHHYSRNVFYSTSHTPPSSRNYADSVSPHSQLPVCEDASIPQLSGPQAPATSVNPPVDNFSVNVNAGRRQIYFSDNNNVPASTSSQVHQTSTTSSPKQESHQLKIKEEPGQEKIKDEPCKEIKIKKEPHEEQVMMHKRKAVKRELSDTDTKQSTSVEDLSNQYWGKRKFMPVNVADSSGTSSESIKPDVKGESGKEITSGDDSSSDEDFTKKPGDVKHGISLGSKAGGKKFAKPAVSKVNKNSKQDDSSSSKDDTSSSEEETKPARVKTNIVASKTGGGDKSKSKMNMKQESSSSSDTSSTSEEETKPTGVKKDIVASKPGGGDESEHKMRMKQESSSSSNSSSTSEEEAKPTGVRRDVVASKPGGENEVALKSTKKPKQESSSSSDDSTTSVDSDSSLEKTPKPALTQKVVTSTGTVTIMYAEFNIKKKNKSN